MSKANNKEFVHSNLDFKNHSDEILTTENLTKSTDCACNKIIIYILFYKTVF